MKTFHKLKMLYSLYKSLHNIDIQIFQFLSVLENYKQCFFRSERISSPSAPFSDFERIQGSTVTQRSLIKLEIERGCWQTDQMERYGDKHMSSVSTSGFFSQRFERKIFRVRNKETLSCFTIYSQHFIDWIPIWLNHPYFSLTTTTKKKNWVCKKCIRSH